MVVCDQTFEKVIFGRLHLDFYLPCIHRLIATNTIRDEYAEHHFLIFPLISEEYSNNFYYFYIIPIKYDIRSKGCFYEFHGICPILSRLGYLPNVTTLHMNYKCLRYRQRINILSSNHPPLPFRWPSVIIPGSK